MHSNEKLTSLLFWGFCVGRLNQWYCATENISEFILYKLKSKHAMLRRTAACSFSRGQTCIVLYFQEYQLVGNPGKQNKYKGTVLSGISSGRNVMEISSPQNVFFGKTTNSSCEKCRLSIADRSRKSREMFWQKGSRILPDFFPPDTQKRKSNHHYKAPSVKRTSVVKQYSWEKEENGQWEAQTIAESWMMYFGLETCDRWRKQTLFFFSLSLNLSRFSFFQICLVSRSQ